MLPANFECIRTFGVAILTYLRMTPLSPLLLHAVGDDFIDFELGISDIQ
jgi:hypothetical protein